MHKINITAVSYTEKHPIVLQVVFGHINLLAEIAKVYSSYTNSPFDVVNICLIEHIVYTWCVTKFRI